MGFPPRVSPGEFFGEMSLVDGGPGSASVEVASNMRLLVVGRRDFWQLLWAAPPLALKIMSTLSRRVRQRIRRVATCAGGGLAWQLNFN